MFTKLGMGVLAASGLSFHAMAQDIELPTPATTGGKPLNEALKERKSLRDYSDKELTPQQLSNLLWAANGITREDGRRTAPTARNAQEIELYIILKDGVYLYQDTKLKLVLKEDIRKLAGKQPFTWAAPVNIVYVADYEKQWDTTPEIKRQYAAVDSGFIAQNVYLHCASEGMACVFRGMIDAEALHKKLGLPATKEVLYGQSVGFPKEVASSDK